MTATEIVLVVDDEPDIRAVVRGMLTAKGYTVLDTGDPQQALRIATQQAVHLLVTDVVMPLMRGTDLAKRIQSVSPWTKVLLMSAYKVAEVTASGLPFIGKPFTPEALVDRVRQVLATPSPFARPAPPPPPDPARGE
jgi:DNA-binding NtrC family response regulator